MQDLVGVTVVLLTCSYKEKEFIRVGYYVNVDYADAELKENPPATPVYEKLVRNILATNPRVTRFKIDWDDQEAVNQENVPPATSTASLNAHEDPFGPLKNPITTSKSEESSMEVI